MVRAAARSDSGRRQRSVSERQPARPYPVADRRHRRATCKAPEDEAIAANTLVVDKARELGTLRHQQRASLHQVLREYQLLGGILLRFVEDESIRLMLTPPAAECVAVVARLHHAVGVLLQETVETFVGLYTQTITEQAERLRQFTRMATHEWRQPLAPISTAVSLLRLPGLNARSTPRPWS